jgi:5-methylcytosine-specific restriction endonuclease McrA
MRPLDGWRGRTDARSHECCGVDLPEPYSDEAVRIIGNRKLLLAIYAALHQSRSNPQDIAGLEVLTYSVLTERKVSGVKKDQMQFDRRVRELYPYFEVEESQDVYRLVGVLDNPRSRDKGITKTVRASVLRDQRCAQCGQTPSEDDVKLHVDHKLPQDWGGTNDEENLQALCAECNEGKKNYFASLGTDLPLAVRQAATHDEPHRRIGEALKAAFPKELRTDVLERIASTKQYQEDWQKRTRELRTLGWKWTSRRERRGRRRTVVYYRLTEWPPEWPAGNIRAEITRRENRRKADVRQK